MRLHLAAVLVTLVLGAQVGCSGTAGSGQGDAQIALTFPGNGEISLAVGESVDLHVMPVNASGAPITGLYTLTYASSSPAILSATDEGLLTGVSVGTATITAVAKLVSSGQTASATAKVIVTASGGGDAGPTHDGGTSTPDLGGATDMAQASGTVLPPPSLPGVPASTSYQVVVTQGGVSQEEFVYVSKAATTQGANNSNGWWAGQLGKVFNYAIFSGPGPFVVTVTKLGSKATSATIRPNRLGLGTVAATMSATGSSVTFTLSAPSSVSVEFSDDASLMDNLVLMAQAAEATTDVPSQTASNVYVASAASYTSFSLPSGKTIAYFPAGVHDIGYWQVPSSVTQIYLADHAFVRGSIYSDRTGLTTGIKINGRGVLSGDQFAYNAGPRSFLLDVSTPGWTLQSAGNVIDGIAVVDSPLYNINLIGSASTVKNVLVHGFQVQNDGLHVSGPNNLVDHCFFHVNDDNIATPTANDHLTVSNTVFWGLYAGSTFLLNYVTHTTTGVQIVHNDLIHADWDGGVSNPIGTFINMLNNQYQSASTLSSYTISDLQVDTPIARLVDTRMIHPSGTQDVQYTSFTFTDIHLDHQGTPNPNKQLLMFDAVDATYNLHGFVFTNFTVNGTKVTSGSTLLSEILYENGPVNTPTFQ